MSDLEAALLSSLDAIQSGAVIIQRESLPTARQLEAVHGEIEREVTHARRWRAFWVVPIREVG